MSRRHPSGHDIHDVGSIHSPTLDLDFSSSLDSSHAALAGSPRRHASSSPRPSRSGKKRRKRGRRSRGGVAAAGGGVGGGVSSSSTVSSVAGGSVRGEGGFDAPHDGYPSLLDDEVSPRRRVVEDVYDVDAMTRDRRTARCFMVFGVLLFAGAAIAAALLLTYFPGKVQAWTDGQLGEFYAPDLEGKPSSYWSQVWKKPAREGFIEEYDVFTLFNVSNAMDVLFHGAAPKVLEVGPFLYHRDMVRADVSADKHAKRVAFKQAVSRTGPVMQKLEWGDGASYQGINPAQLHLRMVNMPLFFLLFEAVHNPLLTEQYRYFAGNCTIPRAGSSEPNYLACLNALLEDASDGQTSLKKALSSAEQGLFPLRSASEWLGFATTEAANKPRENVLWSDVNTYIKTLPKPRDTRWAYFYNTTQDPSNAQQMLNVQGETRMFNRDSLKHGMTFESFAQRDVLMSVAQTTHSGRGDHWNEMDYFQPFPGWASPTPIAGENLHDEYFIHPSMDTSGADQTVSLWNREMLRPVKYSTFGNKRTVQGIKAQRYALELVNTFDTNANYFMETNGLANMTSLKHYAPIYMSPSHFDGFPFLQQAAENMGMRLPAEETFLKSYALVEPQSGMVVESATRLQYSTMLPVLDFDGTQLNYKMRPTAQNGTSIFLPLAVHERLMRMTDKLADKLSTIQATGDKKATLRTIGATVGGVVGFLGLALLIRGVQLKKKVAKRARLAPSETSALLYG